MMVTDEVISIDTGTDELPRSIREVFAAFTERRKPDLAKLSA
jgi:hypothetical protein